MWKNRLGFARLAIQHGYPIVPFASVGAEHGIDIVLDNESPLLAPVQFLAEKLLGTKDGPALVRGVGLTPVPRPERQYYWFGEPIDTTEFMGQQADDNAARRVRACRRRYRTRHRADAGRARSRSKSIPGRTALALGRLRRP